MIIYRKKKTSFFNSLLIIFLISLFFLLIITPGFKGDIEQSLRILLKQPVLYKSKPLTDSKFLDYSIKSFNAIKNYIFQSKNYDELKIDINFSNLEKLRSDRKKALELRTLIDPQKVDIDLNFNGKKFPARARLKGDLSEHWGNAKQWSLRIKLRNNETIKGFNEFSISIFTERDFPYNFVVSEILKENSILTPEYEIVYVKVNGENWGLMLLEEQFSNSFYAKNKIKEAPIFKMTNEKDFKIKVLSQNVENLEDIVKWQGKLETEVFNENEILKKTNIPLRKTNHNLFSVFKNIQETIVLEDENYLDYLHDHIDIIKIAKIVAITSIFGDVHSPKPYNSRYYLNPYNLKIEPILTDFTHTEINSYEKSRELFNSFSLLYKHFFNLPKFQKQYFITLNELDKDFISIEKKFEKVCRNFGKNCENLIDLEAIRKNIAYIKNQKNNIFKDILVKNNYIKKLKFNTFNSNNLNEKKINLRVFDDGEIYVDNLTSEKIYLKEIKLSNLIFCESNCGDEKEIISLNHVLEPSNFQSLNSEKIKIDFEDNKKEFAILNYLDEKDKVNSVSVRIENTNYKKKNFFKLNQTNIEEISNIEGQNYIIKKGVHIINKPIIIPSGYNLIIREGTELKMSKETYIMIKNGVVKFIGKKDIPIKIISSNKNDKWRGIYIYSDTENIKISKLDFVEISDYTYFDNNKIQLTGGINFINSSLKIKNTIFYNSSAEDALNLVNSNFDITNLSINNTQSDAIDIDFGNGTIRNSNFNDIGGDAVDLSGSKVKLKKIHYENIFDKAISAGEETYLELDNLRISSAGIGIASKDSSKVVGSKVKIYNCKNYDFAVYKKKNYFSSGYLKLDNIISCNQPLAQTGSDLWLNGKYIKQKNFETEDLYQGNLL